MKNVVSRVLMMFVMSFTLLVSCSYALEFNSVPNPEKCTYTKSTETEDLNDFINTFQSETGYTPDQIRSISGYKSSDDPDLLSAYTAAMNTLSAKGYHYVYGVNTYSNVYRLLVKTSECIDIGYFNYKNKDYTAFLLNEGDLIYNFGSFKELYVFDSSGLFEFHITPTYHNSKVKRLTDDQCYVWTSSLGYQFEPTLCNAVGEGSSGGDSSIITPSVDLISSETFTSLVNDLTQSELFYQHVPVSHRKNYFVQYDTENDRYIFYFYPSNYFIQGLLMNENDYYLISSENFSWWDNVVNFVQGLFNKDNEESFDYNVVYATVSEEGNFDYWFRSKSNLILDKTLFNFELSPLVFSTSNINFFGKHGGGGIDIDTGEVTVATEPESSLQPNTFDENPIVLNNNPIHEYVEDEQSFWDKVVNKLSSITSGFNSLFSAISSIPEGIFKIVESKTGVGKILGFISPLAQLIIEILGLFITCVAFIGRAITFVYTLPTIEASSAMFVADVETTTKGLVFTGNNWGSHFLSGLDKLKAYSWNGITLWSFFEAFALALVVVIAIKLVRKHYHM